MCESSTRLPGRSMRDYVVLVRFCNSELCQSNCHLIDIDKSLYGMWLYYSMTVLIDFGHFHDHQMKQSALRMVLLLCRLSFQSEKSILITRKCFVDRLMHRLLRKCTYYLLELHTIRSSFSLLSKTQAHRHALPFCLGFYIIYKSSTFSIYNFSIE